MSISATDVASAIQMALWLYDKYFVRINRADERYLEFGNDIKALESSLRRVARAFENANRQQAERSLTIDNDLEMEQKELTGDFLRTLKQCKELLQENSKYHSSGPIDTIRWYTTGIEAQSMQLRERLNFHCSKISFIIKPLELELLSTVDHKLDMIRRQNREIYQAIQQRDSLSGKPTRLDINGLMDVPVALSEMYEIAALESRPFSDEDPFPLKETLNALLYHFAPLSFQYRGGGRGSLAEYNALIKSRWLLGKILESRAYRQMNPCLFRRIVEDLIEEIKDRYWRLEESDWDVNHAASIAMLDESHFRIWVVEDIEPLAPDVTDEGPGEAKLLELQLPAPQNFTQSSLLVFRQNSETEFRLLRMSTLDRANTSILKQIVNIHSFRFIPWYAIPTATEPSNTVGVNHPGVSQAELYDFNTKDDMLAFQQALTGYRVSRCFRVKWQLRKDDFSFKKQNMQGKGWSNLQIWEWDPLERMGAQQGQPDTPDNMTHDRASSSEHRNSIITDFVRRMPNRRASILATPQRDGRHQEVVVSSAPKVPVIVLFTMLNGKLTFLHLPLDPGVGLRRERCGCLDRNSTCCHSVLEMNPGKKSKFLVRLLSAPNNSDGEPIVPEWNLLKLGQPRHPGFKDLECINVSWIDIETPDIDERKRFQIFLMRAIRKYAIDLQEFNSVGNMMANKEQRPNALRAADHHTPSSSRANSFVQGNHPSLHGDNPRRASTASFASYGTSHTTALSTESSRPYARSPRLSRTASAPAQQLPPPANQGGSSSSSSPLTTYQFPPTLTQPTGPPRPNPASLPAAQYAPGPSTKAPSTTKAARRDPSDPHSRPALHAHVEFTTSSAAQINRSGSGTNASNNNVGVSPRHQQQHSYREYEDKDEEERDRYASARSPTDPRFSRGSTLFDGWSGSGTSTTGVGRSASASSSSSKRHFAGANGRNLSLRARAKAHVLRKEEAVIEDDEYEDGDEEAYARELQAAELANKLGDVELGSGAGPPALHRPDSGLAFSGACFEDVSWKRGLGVSSADERRRGAMVLRERERDREGDKALDAGVDLERAGETRMYGQ